MDWLNFYRECADFNRRVTVSPGLRQLRGDQIFQVEEIYFGLAGGFFVTPDGKTGGYLAPAESGTSMVSSGDRRDIAAMAAIAKNHEPPRTIVVPIGVD